MDFTAIGLRTMLNDWSEARTHYLGLHTDAPDDTNELSGDGYARIALPPGLWTDTNDADSGDLTTNAAIVSALATSDWTEITHIAIYDAANGGNRLAADALTAAVQVDEDERFRMPAGDLTITASV